MMDGQCHICKFKGKCLSKLKMTKAMDGAKNFVSEINSAVHSAKKHKHKHKHNIFPK